jgi:metal-dependent HD superfamily phosphatase/phosphodiesterase
MFCHSQIVAFEEFGAIDDFLETIQEVFRGHLGWFLDIVGKIIHLRLAHVSFSTNLVTKDLDRILKCIFGAVAKCWISRLFMNDVS